MTGTSQDLFYLVGAISILWITVFLCVALYYAIRLLKQTNEIIAFWRERIERATNLVGVLKNKILVQGAKSLLGLVSGLWEAKKNKNKK